MQVKNFKWAKMVALIVLGMIAIIGLPLQLDQDESHDTLRVHIVALETNPISSNSECHVSGTCSPMQTLQISFVVSATHIVNFKSWPAAVSKHKTHARALDTPPPRA
tara:strand:+ start:1296 stop:1616 length:321 start_codon:yes stop_codon:yes gene_type:complete